MSAMELEKMNAKHVKEKGRHSLIAKHVEEQGRLAMNARVKAS
jgi:hypothetical protein